MKKSNVCNWREARSYYLVLIYLNNRPTNANENYKLLAK